MMPYVSAFKPGSVNVAVLALMATLGAGAQPTAYTVLHAFTSGTGGAPNNLLPSGNVLYGSAGNGGPGGTGALFKMNTDGTGYTNFYNFAALPNSDGQGPGILVLSGNTLYGTTHEGGAQGHGTIFSVNTNGSGFTVLYTGSSSNGQYLGRYLTLFSNTLYGVAQDGEAGGTGALFNIGTNGVGYTNLCVFPPTTFNTAIKKSTNAIGADPVYLAVSGNVIYGAAEGGGTNGSGTIFKMNLDGTGFTNLYFFTLSVTNANGIYTNGDGTGPVSLVLSDTRIYGAATFGGAGGSGTIFTLSTDGTGFTTLFSFPPVAEPPAPQGGDPNDLLLSGTYLYGTAGLTLFRLNTDGTGFTNLYNLSTPQYSTNVSGTTTIITITNADGMGPDSLLLTGNTLYGTCSSGGGGDDGTVFSLALPVPLNIQLVGDELILTWAAPTYSLQYATSPSGVWMNVPGATSPYTNTIAAPVLFFRLQP